MAQPTIVLPPLTAERPPTPPAAPALPALVATIAAPAFADAAARDRSTAWSQLADYFDSPDTAAEASKHAQESLTAAFATAITTKSGEAVSTASALACLVKAVEADDSNAAAWNALGVEICNSGAQAGVVVNVPPPKGPEPGTKAAMSAPPRTGTSDVVTELAAYQRAVAADRKFAAAWCNLGVEEEDDWDPEDPEGAEVEHACHVVTLSKEEMLVKAVVLDQYRAGSWANLATLLDMRQEHVDALAEEAGEEADPLTVTIAGTPFTAKMMRVRALELSMPARLMPRYWADAASAMKKPTDCFVFAPASALPDTTPAPVAQRVGQLLYARDVALAAVEMNSDVAASWGALGLTLTKAAGAVKAEKAAAASTGDDDEEEGEEERAGVHCDALSAPLTFEGEALEAKLCFVRALEMDADDHSSWFNLSMVLGLEAQDAAAAAGSDGCPALLPSVVINGTRMTGEDCFEKAEIMFARMMK